MRRGSGRAHALAVVVATCALLVPAVPAHASRSSDLAETRREIAETRRKLSTVIRSDQAVLAVLNDVTDRLDVQRSLLSGAQSRLTQIDLGIRAATARLDTLAKQLRGRRAVLGARARTLYMLGPAHSLEAIASADTVDQFVNRAGELDAIANYDQRMIEEVTALANETQMVKELLAARRVDAARIRNEIAGRVETIAGYASVQSEAHGRLSNRIEALRRELAAEQREQARILNLIRSRGSVYTGGGGRLGFAWPIRGGITSPYGPRWGGFHTGIDIDCRTGQGIGASKAGRVIESGWGGGYGRMVIIDHGNGYSTLYAHMSSLYVGRGTRVAQGRKVGACGATGNATGDHLHFEIRINGNHVNPRRYLP